MSRARKGLRTSPRKVKKTKVNLRRRTVSRHSAGPGEIWFSPTPAEAEALGAVFGTEDRIVMIGMSDNLKI